MGIRDIFRKRDETGFYQFKYCPKCGTKYDKGLWYYIGKAFHVASSCSLLVLCIAGISFLAMVCVNPYYMFLPMTSIQDFQYTQIASEFHQEVQDVADNITSYCDINHPANFGDCTIIYARNYVFENFEYENDWEQGYSNGGISENMILTKRKKGDCIDFSITFCSLMKHLGISCIVRSTNSAHRITIIKVVDKWVPIEPQNPDHTGYFSDKTFQGYMI